MQTMKRIHHVLAAAVFVSAAVLVSCAKAESSIDEITQLPEDPQTVTFTATLAPKGEDPGTKAITTGKDGDNKEILNVAWEAGEEIAVYYETTSGHATTTATVKSVDSETGAATISAKFAANAKDKGTAKFVFPASLHNDTGDINEAALLSQNGNLTGANGISTKFDAATGTGTITVSGSEASVSGTVTMTNRVCICKFHFDIVDGGAVGPEREFSPVIIRDGNGHTYTITSDRQGDFSTRGFKRSDDIYIALFPVSGKTVSFYNSSLGSGGYNNYIYTASNTTLTAGKFYRNLSIDMVKDANTSALPFKDLTKGSVSAVDGDIIYMSSSAATANTITIADGASVTIENVNISATGSAGIICSGHATINLEGANTVIASTSHYPAVQVGATGKTLTIGGSGSLNAEAYNCAAGIGGGWNVDCGNITINGGTITANGGINAAGIGSGQGNITNGSCGIITINGGTVTARGGLSAAGIGGGQYGRYGSIVISNGITSVTATPGYEAPAPIGKGAHDSGSGSVTVDGVANWAGAETEHLNWAASTVLRGGNNVTRWTLTHK